MPRISFTHHLRQHAPSDPVEITAATPRAALEAVFTSHPALRGYVLDDRAMLRKHVAMFIDGELRRDALDAPVSASADIYIMQALSGG